MLQNGDDRQNQSLDSSCLFEKAELMYRFVIMYYSYCTTPQDYGICEQLTMVEAHTVTIIDDNPGITISQLAEHYNRTKSAVSQLATKLEKKGLITRKMVSNLKNIHLYTTPEGSKLSAAHKLYDCSEVQESQDALLANCSQREIDAFFKVLWEYMVLRQNKFASDRAKK